MNNDARCEELVYTSREERAKYTAVRYSQYLRGKILDVGCYNKALRKFLSADTEYIGIDIGGDPDIFVDLEKGRIPFRDNAFDCVVCTDVLEHLDNIHDVFDELVRVSKRYIIISLPNAWSVAKIPIIIGRGNLKFYGLPSDKPRDRHKWFFNYTEAEKFLYERARKNGVTVLICEPYFGKSSNFLKSITKSLLRFLFNKEKYRNYFAEAIWCVLEKG